MNVRLVQRFTHDNGEVRVLAQTEAEARAILACNAWDKKDPGWHWYVSEEAKRELATPGGRGAMV